MRTHVVLIGIGGASSSGKTTLTAKLRATIPDCVVLCQDHFWTPADQIPVHPVFGILDLEDPAVTIDWSVFRDTFECFRSDKPFSAAEHTSSESAPLSTFTDTIDDVVVSEWRSRFEELRKDRARQGVKIEWRLVEGFVLYYHPDIIEKLDLALFLRSPEHVLQTRRNGRQYIYADGEIWTDPPGYWTNQAYPAYIRAHSHLFNNGDVGGTLKREYKLTILDGEGTERNMSYEEFYTTAAEAILSVS